MKVRSSLIYLLASTWFWAAPSQAASYSSIYIFGDSLADTGNNAWVFDVAVPVLLDPSHSYAGQRTEVPISDGVDEVDFSLVPTFPYAGSNRYSNGWVWPDYVSAATGLPTQSVLTGLSFQDVLNGQINGTNFAFGGARVGTTPALGFPFSLVDQAYAYEGWLNGVPAPADALYIVEGGGNDLRDAFAAAMDNDPTTDPLAVVGNYLSGMATVLNTLAGLGAQHIAVWNLPDLSLVPAVQALGNDAIFSAWVGSSLMNQQLALLLDSFEAGFSGDLLRFDLFGTMEAIVSNPAAYGLTDISHACAASFACSANPSLANQYLFWDGIHPTTKGHALLAQAFLAVVPIPEPGTLWLTLLALLTIFSLTAVKARTLPV